VEEREEMVFESQHRVRDPQAQLPVPDGGRRDNINGIKKYLERNEN